MFGWIKMPMIKRTNHLREQFNVHRTEVRSRLNHLERDLLHVKELRARVHELATHLFNLDYKINYNPPIAKKPRHPNGQFAAKKETPLHLRDIIAFEEYARSKGFRFKDRINLETEFNNQLRS